MASQREKRVRAKDDREMENANHTERKTHERPGVKITYLILFHILKTLQPDPV